MTASADPVDAMIRAARAQARARRERLSNRRRCSARGVYSHASITGRQVIEHAQTCPSFNGDEVLA